jgi:hypothetical protein
MIYIILEGTLTLSKAFLHNCRRIGPCIEITHGPCIEINAVVGYLHLLALCSQHNDFMHAPVLVAEDKALHHYHHIC